MERMTPRHLNIVWLYHDLMNLYGDRGNILTLQKRADARHINTVVKGISIGETIPTDADIIFFGGGQDQEQALVAQDLAGKKDALVQCLQRGGGLLAVCGGYQLLGEYYQPLQGKRIAGLGILPVYTEAGSERMIGDLVVKPSDALSKARVVSDLVGFENHSGRTFLKSGTPLGKVVTGHGNNGEDAHEGVWHGTAIGTYLHGPLLPKNPELADYLIACGLRSHGDSTDLEPLLDLKNYIDVARSMALERARNRKTSGLGLRS
jgi:CobQ-like glutamine amidotransferase family enzyme